MHLHAFFLHPRLRDTDILPTYSYAWQFFLGTISCHECAVRLRLSSFLAKILDSYLLLPSDLPPPHILAARLQGYKPQSWLFSFIPPLSSRRMQSPECPTPESGSEEREHSLTPTPHPNYYLTSPTTKHDNPLSSSNVHHSA